VKAFSALGSFHLGAVKEIDVVRLR
jgi:hypothetical protein